jgi:hypothetical protein
MRASSLSIGWWAFDAAPCWRACAIAVLRSMNVATSDFLACWCAGVPSDGVEGLDRWNRRGVDVEVGVGVGVSGVSTVVQS